MATKSQFRKTETAHQNEIFKMKGREPTKYGADINDSDKHESSIGSSTTHGYLFTHHDHKTGTITHQWDRSKVKPHLKEGEMDEAKKTVTINYQNQSGKPSSYRTDVDDDDHERAISKATDKLKGNKKRKVGKIDGGDVKEDIDEALVSKATLARYRAKSKTKFKENGGISAALDKQDKAKSLSKSLDRGLAMRMAGDGGHVPNFREEVEVDKKDDKKKKPKLKTFPMPSRPHRESPNDGPQPRKEDLDIVDVVMTQEEPDASPYIAEIETRCDTLVAEIKDGLKKSLFNFNEVSLEKLGRYTNKAADDMVKNDSKANAEKDPTKKQTFVDQANKRFKGLVMGNSKWNAAYNKANLAGKPLPPATVTKGK